MLVATSYPFLEVFWTMLIFFAFVIWIWILITVLIDIFRRHDTSGRKVLWIIFIIILPYLGVFVYLIAEHKGMTERAIKQQEAAQSQWTVRAVRRRQDRPGRADRQAKGPTRGITQTEFDQIKQKALAGA